MKFVYFVLYFCFSFKLLAFSLPARFSELNLTKHAYIYLDKKNELSIEKILNEPSAHPFQKSQHESPSLGYLTYPVWLKITLSQSHYEKVRYIIDIPSSSLDHIHVFEWNEKTKKLKTLEMGDQLPFWSRPIEHTTFAFFLELEKDTETTLFFRFQSDSSLTLPIKIYEEESFHIQANRYKFIFGIYYGFILGLILYNLFLAFQIFEASYFFYVGYMSSLVLLMSTGVGHSFEYLWQNATEWNSRAFSFFNGVVVFFSPLFARAFLRIDLRRGFVNWLLLITAGIGLGFSFYSTCGNILVANKAVNTLSLFGTLILGIAGIGSLKHEPRLAKLFLLAWGIFLFFSFFVILRLLGFLPRNTLTYYGAQIGSVFEALLLSFALADRIKQLEKAREEAVEQKLKLQIQVQENLEYEIRKRSEELQKYTLKLQKDLSMAKKIQSKIFPSGNFYINKFFLSVIYHPKDSV
ncbi:MAG: hypothetical protein N3A69_13585, partial [Leptospiraceae bacterium]|nr:hypothetical protein [Leptospiraceae bacterium]